MMKVIELSMKLKGCDHDLFHEAHPTQQKETPQMSKKLFLFSNDFGSLNVGDPAKRSSLILYFPFRNRKGMKAQKLITRENMTTCKKTKHGYGRP
jgi:hypothetical protein